MRLLPIVMSGYLKSDRGEGSDVGLLKKTFWIRISIFKCGIRIRVRADLSSVRSLPIVKSGYIKFDRGGGALMLEC